MAKESTKKMTFEEALKILKGDIYLCPLNQLQEAMRIVREQDPNNPVLKETLEALQSFEKENNLTEKKADVYTDNYKELESIDSDWSFEKFKSAKNNKDIVRILDRTEICDGKDENVLDAKTKDAYLNLLFEGAKLKAETVLAGDKNFAKLSKRERDKLLKEEIKTIFFADFAQTAIASSMEKPNKQEQVIGSPEYRNYVVRQSRKATEVFGNILQSGKKIRIKVDSILSSCADTALQIERYIGALKKKAQEVGQQVIDKTQAALQAAEKNAGNKFSKLAASIQAKKNKFEKLANTVSKNRYEIWKNLKGGFSDNKFKLIGNAAANAAFGYWTAAAAAAAGAAGAAAAPVLVPAVAAYAAYHAAGSWVFPIVAEMRKINRKKKEAGEEPLKFTDALKQAWKNKMDSRKDKRSYIIGGVLNTGLAAVGFTWLKDGLEAADAAATLVDGAREGLNVSLAGNIAETRHAISLGRAGTSTVAQLTDASIAYAVAAKDPDNKEKSAEFKQTAASALIGLGFNVAFQGLAFATHGNDGADDVVNAVTTEQTAAPVAETTPTAVADTTENLTTEKNNGGSFWSRLFAKKDVSVADTAAVQEKVSDGAEKDTVVVKITGIEEVPASEPEQGLPGLFPKTYTSEAEMGISEKQFKILMETTEGTLKSATGDEVTLDRAYINLEGSMEYFPDKTKEEILYNFNRLYAFMRKAYPINDFEFRETPSGPEYLESRFENLNLGLDDAKMDQLVRFAQENTYTDKNELKEGLKELFPDGLSAKETSSIITTIHSNQRFYQYQQEMEALIGLLGCGDKISAEQAVAINAMLDKTNDILATGKENTQLVGMSLAKGCDEDGGHWITTRETKREEVPEIPELPEIPIEIPEEDIKIDDKLHIEPTKLHVEPRKLPEEPIQTPVEPVERQPKVRKVVVTAMSQLEGENEPEKEGLLNDKRAARMLRRYGEKSKE